MKQRKYTSNGHTFYEVTFISEEHPDFCWCEKPTTHTATVFFCGYWYYLISIDGHAANSLQYRSAKAAVKNGWLIKE